MGRGVAVTLGVGLGVAVGFRVGLGVAVGFRVGFGVGVASACFRLTGSKEEGYTLEQ